MNAARYCLLALCLTFASSTLFSQVFNNTSGDGKWATASNWSTGSVPNSTATNVSLNSSPTVDGSTTIVIGNVTNSGTVSPTITLGGSGKLTLGSSALFSGGTKKSMTLTNGGTINLSGSSPLEIWGDLIITGTFNLSETGSGSLIVHGNVIVSSGATVNMSGNVVFTVGGSFTAGSNSSLSTSGSSQMNVTGAISLGSSSTISKSGTGSYTAASCSCTGCSSQCTGVGLTLPVELTLFESSLSNNKVQLHWITQSEINFDYFDIQRSADGVHFSSIAKEKGHGTSNEIHNYIFTDELPLIGKNYYRLTSVDFDNFQQSFGIILQEYNSEKHFFLSPNPTDGESVTIDTNFDPAGDAKILLYNNVGYPVGTYDMTSDHVLLTFQSPLKNGIYYARYVSSSYVEVVRFIVD